MTSLDWRSSIALSCITMADFLALRFALSSAGFFPFPFLGCSFSWSSLSSPSPLATAFPDSRAHKSRKRLRGYPVSIVLSTYPDLTVWKEMPPSCHAFHEPYQRVRYLQYCLQVGGLQVPPSSEVGDGPGRVSGAHPEQTKADPTYHCYTSLQKLDKTYKKNYYICTR